MSIDFEKVAEAIEKSSPEIKNLMFSVELGDKIGIIAEENKLDEEVALKLFDEVGYVILGLKSRTSFFDSLVEVGIEKNVANLVDKEVNTEVFNKLDDIKNKTSDHAEQIENVMNTESLMEFEKPSEPEQPKQIEEEEIKSEEKPRENLPENSVGNDFEQIILNQTKAMQPAHEAPLNLPIENSQRSITNIKIEEKVGEKLGVIHNYITSDDPYREPIS